MQYRIFYAISTILCLLLLFCATYLTIGYLKHVFRHSSTSPGEHHSPLPSNFRQVLRNTWIIQRNTTQLRRSQYEYLLDLQDFDFILNNASKCASTMPSKLGSSKMLALGKEIYLIIIISSSRGNFDERRSIRGTWGSIVSFKNLEIRLVFLLGGRFRKTNTLEDDSRMDKSILEESERFGDIVLGNFEDSNRNLSYKHLMGYKWVTQFCPGASFVLKTDDDVFVDILQLVQFLQERPLKNTILCHLIQSGDTFRQPNGTQWHITLEEYPHDTFPAYCSGLAYLITPDVVQRILKVSQNARFFWVDDMFVTGILREIDDNVTEPVAINQKYLINSNDFRKWRSLPPSLRRKPLFVMQEPTTGLFKGEMMHVWT